jgi:hypothetical protein
VDSHGAEKNSTSGKTFDSGPKLGGNQQKERIGVGWETIQGTDKPKERAGAFPLDATPGP